MFIKLINVKKRYENDPIINRLNATFGYGDKVGLIGKNGTGKTTLLRIMVGLEPATSGSIIMDPPSLSLFYHQQVIIHTDWTIKDFVIASIPALAEIKNKLTHAFDVMLLQEYQDRGGYLIESKIPATLRLVHLAKYSEGTFIKSLSGGERTRLQLVPILIAKPDILLLDEPTNHLDIEGITFLENYINQYKGIVITATHDRRFLTNCANRIISLDKGEFMDVHGNYPIYMREKELQEEHVQETYRRNKEKEAKLTKNLESFQKMQYQAQTHKKFTPTDNDKMGFDFLAEKAARKFSRKIETIHKTLQDLPELEKPHQEWQMKLDFEKAEHAKFVFHIVDVSKSFSATPLIHEFSRTIYSHERICLVGPNGSGKTTLLKLLTKELTPDTGTIEQNENIHIGYLSQDHLEIEVTKTLIQDFLDTMPTNESEARTYLHKFLFTGDMVYRLIETFSQGEKAKYAFAKMLYTKPQFLLLDEPTNYMDIASKEIIEQTLTQYTGGFILATHDRNLIDAIHPDEIITMDHV